MMGSNNMENLWNVIAELGLELHPDRIEVVAKKIASLDSVEQFALVKSSFGPNYDRQQIAKFSAAWVESPHIVPPEVAAALRGASATAQLTESRGRTELVWTGPKTGFVPVRSTPQVLRDLIDSAESRLFIVSFVAYDVIDITKALQNAVERKVAVSILLERSTEHGGKVTVDSVQTMKAALPSVAFYSWESGSDSAANPINTGAVHAKCAVADGKIAFITSANISNAAMDRNMELGILVRGGDLPEDLHKHLDSLVNMGIIEKI